MELSKIVLKINEKTSVELGELFIESFIEKYKNNIPGILEFEMMMNSEAGVISGFIIKYL